MGIFSRLFGDQPARPQQAAAAPLPSVPQPAHMAAAQVNAAPPVKRPVPQPQGTVNLSYREFTEQRPEAVLDIVGEASYQGALEKIDGGAVAGGWHTAFLIREPKNPYDRNAIAVYVATDENLKEMGKVGYIARDLAPGYGRVFPILGSVAIRCRARLKGGGPRRPGYAGALGVELHLGSASELLCELWSDANPLTNGNRWSGRTVVFTGESLHSLHGLPLDRFGQEFLARKAGCRTWPRITKQVDLCVSSSPHNLTGKLRKAEEYGIELIHERDFWREVGVKLPLAALA